VRLFSLVLASKIQYPRFYCKHSGQTHTFLTILIVNQLTENQQKSFKECMNSPLNSGEDINSSGQWDAFFLGGSVCVSLFFFVFYQEKNEKKIIMKIIITYSI
jgi:hypothetical protein